MSVGKIALVCFFVLLIVASGMWLFRYAPLGSFAGNGGGVYVYDRFTGNILWMVGNNKNVVKSPPESAKNFTGGRIVPKSEIVTLPTGYVLDR